MAAEDLDSPDQVQRRGSCIDVEFWYPTLEGHVTHIQVGLIDVRAADDIRIHYDFDRDGYVIEQASVFEWDADDDDVGDPGWKEVAFIKAWAQQVRPPRDAE